MSNAPSLVGIFASAPASSAFSRESFDQRTKRAVIPPSQKRYESHDIFGNSPSVSDENVRRTANVRSVTQSNVPLKGEISMGENIKSAKGRIPLKIPNDSHVDFVNGSSDSSVSRGFAMNSLRNVSALSVGGVKETADDGEMKTARGNVHSDKNVSKIFVDALSPKAMRVRKAPIRPAEIIQKESQKTSQGARKNQSNLSVGNNGLCGTNPTDGTASFGRDSKIHKNVRNDSSLWSDGPQNVKRMKGATRNKNEGNGNFLTNNWK